ncbi:MAG: hypothetical protein NTW16_04800 [Bacteroidetes bacterium]|nr:hypothetical protein [Bacteroidota bacterium]
MKIETKHLFLLFNFTLCFFFVHFQDLTVFIKEKAVKIDKIDCLNDEVYHLLSSFKMIMVGEVHGTNEPAAFVSALTKLMASHGDSVQVGLEIPSRQMTSYLNLHSDSSIYHSDFFISDSNDGRASKVWANLICELNKSPGVRVFFYDINDGDCRNPGERDSVMYLKIKNQILAHMAWKTITLSGNLHNMLLPYKEKTKMALYLTRDNLLNYSNKICSLNHYYQNGTMLNNTGNGLELHQVNNSLSVYSTAVDYENYLLLFPANTMNRYSGIYFTRNVTAAMMTSN